MAGNGKADTRPRNVVPDEEHELEYDELTPDIEAPEADLVEQTQELAPEEVMPATPPPDADPADVAEQAQVVDLDEDDYR